MLSWVVKVVPQPPEPPPKKVEEQKEGKPAAPPPKTTPPPATAPPPKTAPPPVQEKRVTFQDEVKHEATRADKPRAEVQAAAENGPAAAAQPSVLTWISSALPQPAPSPTLNRANSTTKEDTAPPSKPDDKTGVMAWISQGLEKVVPQPDLKSKEPPAAEQPLEVHQPAAAPERPITVVEVESDTEDSKPHPPRMIDWIKQGIEKVVPQPEIYIRAKADGNVKTEVLVANQAPAPPPTSKPSTETKSTKAAEQQPNMMGWIVNEIGRMLPQPVQRPAAGGDEVQTISIVQKKMDLVLEDVEEDQNTEAKMEVKETNQEPQNKEDLQPLEKETRDAEVQMDQRTPVMDSIKKEVGETVLAHMEERLQKERLEAAREAEEMARKAAEEAVRQLEVEHSAKIIIETLTECNEQLSNILEEENEDDPECQGDVCRAEGDATCVTEVGNLRSAPQTLEVTPSTDVEMVSESRDVESPVSQPITQQPEQQPPEATINKTKATGGAAEDEGGCGVPEVCSPIKSFLLRFPRAAEHLERCRTLMYTPPTLPPQLAPLLQLSKQAHHCCMSIAGNFMNRYSSPHSQKPPRKRP